jgi:hypothetical protein
MEEGRAGLLSALSIDAGALNNLLHDTCVALGEKRYKELLAPRPDGPTGALLDYSPRRSTPSWWEQQVNGWLDECGVEVRIDGVSWSHAEADAARAGAARLRDFERVARARRPEQEAEILLDSRG